MNHEAKLAIFNKIKEYDTIFLFRHIRNDGDCVGASKGLQAILRASFPEKSIYLIEPECSEYLAFLGPEDGDVADEVYAKGLAVVVDTATEERISNKKYRLCRELIKIDHHIPVDNYGNLSWVEPDRSSASEMIVDFYDTFKEELVLTKEAALFLYTGIVTDSGRFRYEAVDSRTMHCAGILLDTGIDTQTLFAHLYLEDYHCLKFKAHVYENMNLTENGVAYIHVTRQMREDFGISDEDASNAVDMMNGIKGCLCWIAFVDSHKEEGTIRARMRSRFMAINQIAEHYRGGGHACASGATVYSEEEKMALVREADAACKLYKETHEGWL